MTDGKLPPAQYISSDAGLVRLAEELSHEPLIAVDTESNSLYAYQEQVCLIQLSTRSADYIVDPLAIRDMQPLGRLMADSNIEKVFHAAEYDIMCMKRDFGFSFANLFDTMIAARVCGHKAVGLGKLLEDHQGVSPDKSHQRDNWGERPLPAASLRYAQMDTHYLPSLRDMFYAELVEMTRWEESREIFAETCDIIAANGKHFDPEGFWEISIPNRLNLHETGMLKALYILRDEIAQRRDMPPFKIFGNKVLVALAQSAPSTLDELKTIRGVSSWMLRRYGDRVLQAIRTGKSYQLSYPPYPPAPEPETVDRYTALQNWRKLRAQDRGVESDIIISKHTLWKLAELCPHGLEDMTDIQGLGPWRLAAYGEELLEVIRAYNKNGR